MAVTYAVRVVLVVVGGGGRRAYDKQCPDSVVEEHNGCDEEHHQAGELGELFAVRNE